jgi:hypothetical protein
LILRRASVARNAGSAGLSYAYRTRELDYVTKRCATFGGRLRKIITAGARFTATSSKPPGRLACQDLRAYSMRFLRPHRKGTQPRRRPRQSHSSQFPNRCQIQQDQNQTTNRSRWRREYHGESLSPGGTNQCRTLTAHNQVLGRDQTHRCLPQAGVPNRRGLGASISCCCCGRELHTRPQKGLLQRSQANQGRKPLGHSGPGDRRGRWGSRPPMRRRRARRRSIRR